MVIENEINLFIKSEENNGALLITGKWGCGKSYLIKKCACDLEVKDQYAIAIISLFGVDTIATLNEKVRNAYLEFASGVFGKKARKIYGTLKKVATDSANITAAALPRSAAASAVSVGVSSALSFNPLTFINVKNTVGQGDNQRKFVLIFDDFERCNIEKQDLLGAINEYSENIDIKVIIVADEAKIEDDGYAEFKEKVIVRTLVMSADYPKIIDSIIQEYRTTNKDYINFLCESKDCIINAFLHSGYNNLRTLKSCLMDFERIFDGWCHAGVPLDALESVFYKFCAITYEAKKGHYSMGPCGTYLVVTEETDQKKRDSEVAVIKSKYLGGTFDYILKSISRWVVSGEWDIQIFQNELRQLYLKDEISHEEKFVLYRIWDLEQEDIDQGMPSLVERAYNGDASRDELISLLQKTHTLKTYNISLPCDVDYKKIDWGLEQRLEKVKNGTIQENQKRTFTENSQIDVEAIPINEKIEKMDDQMYLWRNRRLLISYLQGDRNITQYSLKDLCIGAFDDELYQLFTTKYFSSCNMDKGELCRTLLRMDFNNPQYSSQTERKTSIKNFNTLISVLTDLSEGHNASIDTAIHKAFIEELEQRIAEMSSQ